MLAFQCGEEVNLTVHSFTAVKVCLISVASFEDSNFYQIPNALKDANQFINLLSKLESINQSDILYLENPKLPKLSSTLTKLFSEAQQNDTIFLYFLGHGFAEGENIYLPMSDSKSLLKKEG
uniref:Peptidase C14 caspase domain-containing protein n=1 Tax=Fervidobacterium nodosum TaxID=2424 RepID=A0A7C5Y7W4_9BACT